MAAALDLSVWSPPLDPLPRSLTLVADEKRKTDPSLPGVAAGIDEMLRTQSKHGRTLDTHSSLLARVESQVHVNTSDISNIKHTLADHGDRLVDLERLPHAPHPSLVERYDPDETPGGGIRVEPHMWAGIQKVLSDLREEVSGAEQARAIEVARAEAAEAREVELKSEAKAEAEADRKAWDRRLKWVATIGAGLLALQQLAAHYGLHF